MAGSHVKIVAQRTLLASLGYLHLPRKLRQIHEILYRYVHCFLENRSPSRPRSVWARRLPKALRSHWSSHGVMNRLAKVCGEKNRSRSKFVSRLFAGFSWSHVGFGFQAEESALRCSSDHVADGFDLKASHIDRSSLCVCTAEVCLLAGSRCCELALSEYEYDYESLQFLGWTLSSIHPAALLYVQMHSARVLSPTFLS